jgi:hypothetical protein
MEILRVPPYDLTVNIQVDEPSTDYPVIIRDMADLSISTITATSDENSIINVDLPSKYDGQYEVQVYENEYYYDVVRPYVDPNTKGTTATEIAEYTKNEQTARAIIDSVIRQGFYYKKEVIETAGLGADYLPLWIDAKKVLKVYENNVLVYDAANPDDYERAFEITADGTAIQQYYSGTINRNQGASLILPLAAADTDIIEYYYRGFPRTFDYTIVVESGYKVIPSDIVKATELLVEDLACGKLEYYKRMTASYSTDQFRIQFDRSMFEGTGNIIVDKILSKYAKSIQTLGVL